MKVLSSLQPMKIKALAKEMASIEENVPEVEEEPKEKTEEVLES